MTPFQDYLNTHAVAIETCLSSLLPQKSTYDHALFSAAKYAIEGPAKRIRPILLISVVDAFGKDLKLAMEPACAIEIIHTYSMIHDDLPAMDNDDFRRGKPSLHKAYSEGLAILTGDYFLTLAFEILSHAKGLKADQKLLLIQELTRASGANGMLGGQVLDIQATGQRLTMEKLEEIHRLKTGALFRFSLLAGGIIAEATAKEMEALDLFAKEIGLAFQIIDDILDVVSGEEKHGREGGSDFHNKKMTYASFLGIEGAKNKASQHFENAIVAIRSLPMNSQRLEELAHFIIFRK